MQKLIDTLLTTLPISDEDFSKLFAEAYDALNMSDADLARYLSTSRPTIVRWSQGITQPYHTTRREIFYLLAKKLEDINEYCDEAKAYTYILAGDRVIGPGGYHYRYNNGIEKLYGKDWTPCLYLYSGKHYRIVPLKPGVHPYEASNIGKALASVANYNIKQKAIKSLLNLQGISCELLEDDLVYIRTGESEGITVKVIG